MINEEETWKVTTLSERIDSEGMLKKHSETRIIGAVNLTDVEERATNLLDAISDGAFKVVSANPINFAKAILDGEDKENEVAGEWYAVQVSYSDKSSLEYDEDRPKKWKDKYLVRAYSLAGAEQLVENYFEADGGYDFELKSASFMDYAGVVNLETRTFTKTKKGWAVQKVVTEK